MATPYHHHMVGLRGGSDVSHRRCDDVAETPPAWGPCPDCNTGSTSGSLHLPRPASWTLGITAPQFDSEPRWFMSPSLYSVLELMNRFAISLCLWAKSNGQWPNTQVICGPEGGGEKLIMESAITLPKPMPGRALSLFITGWASQSPVFALEWLVHCSFSS